MRRRTRHRLLLFLAKAAGAAAGAKLASLLFELACRHLLP